MRILTKAMLAAFALTGSVMSLSAPAKAQVSAYVGVGGDPYYDGYQGPDPYADPYADPYYADPYDSAYADPYACDYYDPPWGYPPDYCAYQTWQEPIYVGGLWYSGPIYYRGFGANRLFWLNGGWHRDEWRGPRPGRIDWGRNMRWSGPALHRGGNFAGRNWNGGNFNRGVDAFRGRDFGGGRNSGQGRNFGQGRDFGGRNFVAPQNGGQRQAFQGGSSRERFGGASTVPRASGGPGFVRPNIASNNGGVRGRFGGQAFQARGPRPGSQGGPRAGGGGNFQRGGGGGERGGGHGQGHHGR